MAAQEVLDVQKYQPSIAEHSLVVSSARHLQAQRGVMSPVSNIRLGSELPFQFSVEDKDYISAFPDVPRFGPSREQSPSSDVPWGRIAALATGLGFVGAEATLFSKVGLKKGLIINGTVLTGIACLAQPTEANTAITAVAGTAAPQPTESPTVEPTPTGPDGYIWNSELNGWFTSHIVNPTLGDGIPMIDQPADGFNKNILFTFDAKEGVPAFWLNHPDNLTSSTTPSFTRIFFTRLLESVTGKNILKISDADYWKFRGDLADGKIVHSFLGSDGKEYPWSLTTTNGVNEYAVKWEDADPAKDPRYIEWSWINKQFVIASEPGAGDFRTMTIGEKGNMIIISASKKPMNELTQQEFFDMMFVPIGKAFLNENQSISEFYYNVNSGAAPHIVIQP